MQLIDDDIDFSAYMAEPEASQKVKPASSWVDELIDRLATPELARGTELPWRKTADMFRLRKNEITLWPGINGHGKSLVIGQIMLGAMAQGEKVMIASMEMKPAATMERMCKQAWGWSNISPVEAREFSQWTDSRFWIYDHLGSVNWHSFIGVLRYACAELGITQIVIDSLMRCGIADDDYKQQKQFMDALCTLKMDYPVHIHLVLHSRKLADENQMPGKFDVKGTGTLTDLADNVITVWRNKAKENAQQKTSQVRNAREQEVINSPDTFLIVDKQRNWEWEGKIGLWYIPGVQQYVEAEHLKSYNVMELFM